VGLQVFLDGIEPDERIHHAPDPARWLEPAATLAENAATAGQPFSVERGSIAAIDHASEDEADDIEP
jgi:hypothetical protein